MRALGYYAAKPDSDPNVHAKAFDAFCVNGNHIAGGVFGDELPADGRPQWDGMVRQIAESGRGYLVVVPSARHLGDTLVEQMGRVLQLDALTCEVVCDDEEYPDPLQNALRSQTGSSDRSERIREGMRAKAAQGLGLGKPPYGYRIGADGTFSPVEQEANVVAAMYDRYLSHDGGVRSIANWLNDSGVRTRRGQRWSMVTVRDILRNSAYIGTYKRFGLRIPGTYQPIVAHGVFRQVQERMQSRTPIRRHAPGEPFLLSGILYCGHCGQRMMGVTRRQMWRKKDGERSRGEYRYYQCQSRINRSQCDYHTTKAPDLEAEVVERLMAIDPAADGIDTGDAAALAKEQRASVDARMAALDRRYRSIVERAAGGGLTLSQLRGATAELIESKQQLVRQRQLVDDGPGGMRKVVQASLDKLRHAWENLETAERQEVLRTLVGRVVVKDGQVEVVAKA
jgi:site-specific DNA recombinase